MTCPSRPAIYSFEKVAEKCKGLPRDKRTIVGGGIDVSEGIANKTAIRNALGNMAQCLMERLCTMNLRVLSQANPALKFEGTGVEEGKATLAMN